MPRFYMRTRLRTLHEGRRGELQGKGGEGEMRARRFTPPQVR